jgi:hypothetical protein
MYGWFQKLIEESAGNKHDVVYIDLSALYVLDIFKLVSTLP